MTVTSYDILCFDGFLAHWAVERPDWAALSQEDHHFTYGQLEERTAKIVAMLLGLGLKKGDRIAWIGKNSDLYFALFYGAARIGVVTVPVGWRLAPAEWAYIAKDTGARILFAGQGFKAGVHALARDIAGVDRVIPEEEARDLIDATARTAFEPAGPDDAVLQLYTSGTTGNPKGAVLSNRNLFALRKMLPKRRMPIANGKMMRSFSSPCPARILAEPDWASWPWRQACPPSYRRSSRRMASLMLLKKAGQPGFSSSLPRSR